MTFLPIVDREMRVGARRPATYWMRVVFALLAVALGVCIYCVNLSTAQSVVGPFIFRGLAGLTMVYCLLSGWASTADCLSVEKREGTLGLLFLTDLKSYDVVLGKLAATSLTGFYRLLAVFPVMAIPLLMGGTTSGEFWRLALVLIVTFLFSLAVGIFGSALSREARAAVTNSLFLLLVPVIILPLCGIWQMQNFTAGSGVPWLFFGSPPFLFAMGIEDVYHSTAANAGCFWWSLGTIHGLTWLLVMLACWIVPRSWQDRPVPSVARPGWRQQWRYGDWPKRLALRKHLLDINAFFWLVARDRRKRFAVWMVLGIEAAATVGLCVFANVNSDFSWRDISVCLITSAVAGLTFIIMIAGEAGQRLAEDQAAGALELLLSTPLSVRDILRGQRLALQRQFLRPVLAVLAVELALAWFSQNSFSPGEKEDLLLCLVACLLVFVMNIIALYWVGMYSALTQAGPAQAAGAAVMRILFLPGMLFVLLQAALAYCHFHRGTSQTSWECDFGLWAGLSISANFVFGLRARHQLLAHFRQLPLRRQLRQAARAARRLRS